ncbi:MAG TPA: glycosyltransferase, partial [Tabrizicola sp.]|nr:glycosyltransferase [Tabrizicola sp.]
MQMDVLFVGDFRFPGGTSTSIAAEARALAASGYSLGLVSLATGPLSAARPIHPEIRALVDTGLAAFVPPGQPVTTELTLLHHPSAFMVLPAVAPLVTSRRTLLVVHHPANDATGVPQYDVPKVVALVHELFGSVVWAPVGPKVRQSLERLASPPPMTPEDWVNILDPTDWAADRSRPLPHPRPVIGRHSRPEPEKWPDDRETFLAAYPDAPDLAVRLMGYSPAQDRIVGERPANWDVLPFGAMPAREFLQGLDYFSYFHSSRWIEAFGRSILEAMAAGLVCLLPPDFRDVFEDAAIYCAPDEVAAQVRRLERDPDAKAALSSRARQLVRDRYGPRVAVDRVSALIGPPSTPKTGRAVQRSVAGPRILYFTSNGIGMGHLARCMASARRLSPAVTPVVVTMSKAFSVVRDEGMTVEHLGYFRALDIPHAVWSAKLATELGAILDYHAPDVFVFDGNVPYEGMVSALDLRPQMWRVWQRRPLWRPETEPRFLERSSAFDLVIEPGEIAAPVDRGPTVNRRDCVLRVPPIRFLDTDEALPSAAAKAL